MCDLPMSKLFLLCFWIQTKVRLGYLLPCLGSGYLRSRLSSKVCLPYQIRFSQTRVESFIFFIRLPSRSRSGSGTGMSSLFDMVSFHQSPNIDSTGSKGFTCPWHPVLPPNFIHFAVNRDFPIASRSKPFFGWGPRVPPPTTQFLSSELRG